MLPTISGMSRLLGLLIVLIAVPSAGPLCGASPNRTENIVLVTVDGLRWQEVFGGIDQALMHAEKAGMKDAGPLRERLWHDSAAERRKRLLPFFWAELAQQGVVLGNRNVGSTVRLSNGIRVSYPGYSEILTGRARDDVVRGNDEIQNPSPTVLEVFRRHWELPRKQVALFASWSVFQFIGEHTPGSVFINAGYRALEGSGHSPQAVRLGQMQFDLLTPWSSVRHDYFTFELAMEHLRSAKPRVLYIALGETDDWAHEGRYDRVLETAEYFDKCLKELWETLQSMPQYKDKTSLVVTTDHGRGGTLKDWTGHGSSVEGAEFIWIAAMGPDTEARGEVSHREPYFQRDIAPTLLQLAGIDYRELDGVEGKPIPVIAGEVLGQKPQGVVKAGPLAMALDHAQHAANVSTQ